MSSVAVKPSPEGVKIVAVVSRQRQEERWQL